MKLADSGMTTRSHHVIFATGCGIFVVVTLLFLLQKTHTQLQDVQMRFIETQSRLKSLSSQFDCKESFKSIHEIQGIFLGGGLLQLFVFCFQHYSSTRSVWRRL